LARFDPIKPATPVIKIFMFDLKVYTPQ